MNEPVAWMDKRTNKCVVFINTPPSDNWIPLYTTPQKYCPSENNAAYEKGLIEGMPTQIESQVHRAVESLVSKDVERYQWLRAEFAAGRETYIGEWMPSGEALDEYIDEQLRKAQEK